MAQILVQAVERVRKVVVVLEGEVAELAVNPTSSSPQKGDIAGKFLKDILLKHKFRVLLVLLAMRHVGGKQTVGVQEGLLEAEIFMVLLHVLNEHRQVLGQVV